MRGSSRRVFSAAQADYSAPIDGGCALPQSTTPAASSDRHDCTAGSNSGGAGISAGAAHAPRVQVSRHHVTLDVHGMETA